MFYSSVNRIDYDENIEQKKGFTLVELLVVISIIALLLSILMPSLQKARDHAKKTLCASNMKQVMLASFIYASENEDRFPGSESAQISDWPLSSSISWARSLRPIIANQWRVYGCSAAKKLINPSWGMPPAFPEQISEDRPGTSYLITEYCGFRKSSSIPSPANVIMYWEGYSNTIWAFRYPNGDPTGPIAGNWDWPLFEPPEIHSLKPNYAFADGHVESGSAEKMWRAEYFWPGYRIKTRTRP